MDLSRKQLLILRNLLNDQLDTVLELEAQGITYLPVGESEEEYISNLLDLRKQLAYALCGHQAENAE